MVKIMGRLLMWGAAWSVAVIMMLLGTQAQVASATEPWWHVSTISRPTHFWSAEELQELHVGAATIPEVQKVPLTAKGKEVCLGGFDCIFVGQSPSGLPEFKEGLEAAYGARVSVTESTPGIYMIAGPAHTYLPVIEAVLTGSVEAHGSGRAVVMLTNLGDASGALSGAPVVISDALPAGVDVLTVEAPAGAIANLGDSTCQIGEAATFTPGCSYESGVGLLPFESIEMEVNILVPNPSSEETQHGAVSVTGGGVPALSATQNITLSTHPVPFGIESYSFTPEEEGGARDTQAGSHPFQLTTIVDLNQGVVTGENHRESVEAQPGVPRNFRFHLPPGLVGNASATAQCPESQFMSVFELEDQCPPDTAVGAAAVTIIEQNQLGLTTLAVPVFNLVPSPGEPARFGFTAGGVPVVLNTALQPGNHYGVTVSVDNASESATFLDSIVTLWGVPGDERHKEWRGTGCLYYSHLVACHPEAEQPTPLLRLPTSCGVPLSTPMEGEPWNVPLGSEIVESTTPGEALDGCNRVPFEPSIQVAAGTSSAASPAGLTVHVKVPQESANPPEGTAESDLRNTTVTLPAGLKINPAAAAGLQGCSEQEIGYLSTTDDEPVFSEETHEEQTGEQPHKTGCREASRVGTVEVSTPLLKEHLVGAVYQATQETNPFGSLLAIYIIAEAPNAGVRVRLAGRVQAQPGGQLVSTFPQTPQTPFSEFALKFFGGSKAPLATSGCGTYTTQSEIVPWSSTALAPVVAHPSSFFEVTSGPNGTPCSSVGGFAPAFAAGTTNNAGGASSPFTLTLNRKDGEQTLSTIATTLPPGLTGMISKVTPCPEPQAATGACPENSKLGYVRVSAGVGSEPILLPEPGRQEDPIYLTAPYGGAPFGLSIVAHAEAGPFNLGTIVIRGKISVNPITAQASIETNPSPTELQNIPLDVRGVEAVINRSGFMLNPTNCAAMSIMAIVGSSEGAHENVSAPFEAADCATLPFKPGLKAATHAKHTRRNGAYLKVTVTSGPGQARIKSIFVELPKLLPSRTETLKLACSAKQFEANPEGCPAGAKVGTAIAHTPVLPVPLTGSAIFVSHGGAAFPDLALVLHGDGVTIKQIGNTNIVKNVTSSDFKSVPDVPLSSVEVTLPAGSHSALAATGNLCTTTATKRVKTRVHGKTVYRERRVIVNRKLMMPTTITGQNGAVFKQNTKIAVDGCSKVVGQAGKHKASKKKTK